MRLKDILDSNNVAEDLDEDTLKKLASAVRTDFDLDLASRSDWESRNEEWLKLAMQVVETKNTPWPNASNVKYPLLTTAAIQFQSRAYPALIQGTKAVKAEHVGFDMTGEKTMIANRVSKHMSYQVLHQMKEWEESMDKLLFVLPIVGTCFKKTYFDADLGRNVSEYVHPYDLVVNYGAKSLDHASQKTHILSYYENELVSQIRGGFYRDVKFGDNNSAVREKQSDDTQGFSRASNAGYDILESHCWYDLDEDGYKEPYIVTMLANNNEVLRIVPRFSDKSVEINQKDEVIRITPDEYFTNYTFFPDPDSGVYGLGFGALLGPINDAVNTLINQLIDAGTLSNSSSGFLGRGIQLGKGGDLRFKPNEWKTVNNTGNDLRQGIVPLPVNAPSNVLLLLLGQLVESGQRLSSTMDIMMGESPGQNQAATTTMAVLEQGLKVYTSIHKRVYRALKSEYEKIFRLNSLYLSDEEYFRVLDYAPPVPQQQGQQMLQAAAAADEGPIGKASIDDYNTETMDIFPAADPNVVTQSQMLLKAEALMPLMQAGLVNREVAVRRILEAQEQPNVQELLQMPPPQPDPEVVMEEVRLKHEMNIDKRKLGLDEERIASEAMKDEAQAVLASIKAEELMREGSRKDLDLEESVDEQKRMAGRSDNEGAE